MKFIRILGKKYSLEFVKEGDAALKGSDGVNAIGRTYQQTCRLVIATSQSKAQMDDTILHECIHGLDYNLQLELSEHQVHRLACGINAILKDNPQLAKRLATN